MNDVVTETHKAKRNIVTDIVIYEEWRKAGKFHRADGPARIFRDAASGTTTREEWLTNGKLHRVGGPAIIEHGVKYADGTTGNRESWWENGEIHRDDGPAVIVCDPATGAATYEAWHESGKLIKGHKNGEAITPATPLAFSNGAKSKVIAPLPRQT